MMQMAWWVSDRKMLRMHPQARLVRVLACLLGFGLLLDRKPQSFSRPQVWAEDGAVFFQEAYQLGWHALFERYAGYFHALPRLCGWAAVALWPGYAPEFFTAVFVVVFLWVAWFATSARVGLRHGVLLVVLIVLPPVEGEVFLNLTNVQWMLAWLPLLVLVAAPAHSSLQRFHDLWAVILAGLSGLFSIFFLPLFILKVSFERTVWSVILLSINFICGLIQVSGFGTAQRAAAVANPVYSDYWRVLGRPMYALIFGPAAQLMAGFQTLQSAFGVLTVLLLGLGVWLGIKTKNRTAVYFLCAGTSMWAAVLVSISGNPSILLSGGARYFFLQSALLPAAFIVTGLLSPRFCNLIAVVFGTLVLLNFSEYSDPPLQDLRWRRQLKCLEHRPSDDLNVPRINENKNATLETLARRPIDIAAPQTRPPRTCRIFIHPTPWFVDLPAKTSTD